MTILRVNDENGNLIGARDSERAYTHAIVVSVTVAQYLPPPPGSADLYAVRRVIVPGLYEVASYAGSLQLAEARVRNCLEAEYARRAGGEIKIVPVVIGVPADKRAATAKVKANREEIRKFEASLTHYRPGN